MDELIARLVADIGIDRATAEKAVGIILDFLVKEGPADKVQPLLAKLPGAEAVIQRAASENGSAGMGGTMGGVMGAGMRMMSEYQNVCSGEIVLALRGHGWRIPFPKFRGSAPMSPPF